MNSHVFVVDGVCHRGDVRNLLRSVTNLVSAFPGARTVWVARPDQAPYLDPHQTVCQANEGSDYEPSIDRWIDEASQNGEAGSVFHVLSYNTAVLGRAAALNTMSRVVTTEHLGKFRDEGYGFRGSTARPVPAPTTSAALTLDEAVELAKRVLRERGHTSQAAAMHQPQLRLAMGSLDPRARRVQSDPTTWRLIRDLVDRGQRDGWLRQERRGPSGYEFVWLVEQPATALPKPPAAAALERASESSEAQTPVRVAKRRDQEMEEVLRMERIGSPPIPRKHVFDAVEAVIRDSTEEPPTVATLMGRTCVRAQKMAADAGYTKEQYWSAICECVFRAMLQAQVLLMPDGVPVPAKIGQHSSKAARLADNFRQRTEALMLERIIQKRDDIVLADAYTLALTLYQQGRDQPVSREDLLAKVDALLLLLQSEERVDTKADDRIVALVK